MTENSPKPPAKSWGFLYPWAGLAGLIGFHVFSNLYWLSVDHHPLVRDEYVMIKESWSVWDAIFGDPDASVLERIARFNLEDEEGAHGGLPRPPLLMIIGAYVLHWFGPNPDTMVFSATIFFAATLLGTFLFSTTFYPPWRALVCTAVVSLVPGLYAFSRFYSLDFLMVPFLVWAMFALVKSRGFAHTGWSWLSGLLTGMSMLAKPYGLFFIAIPWLWTLGSALLPHLPFRKNKGVDTAAAGGIAWNFIVAASMAFLAPAWWYLKNAGGLHKWQTEHPQGGGAFSVPGAFPDLGATLILANNFGLLFTLLAASAAGVAVIAIKFRCRGPMMLVTCWALGSWLLLAFFVTMTHPRYGSAALPAFGILAAIAVLEVPNRKARIALTSALLCVLGVQFAFMTYGDNEKTSIQWALPKITYDVGGPGNGMWLQGRQPVLLFATTLATPIVDTYACFPPYRGINPGIETWTVIAKDLVHRKTKRANVAAWREFSNAHNGAIESYYPFFAPGENLLSVQRWAPDLPVLPLPFQFAWDDPRIVKAVPPREELDKAVELMDYVVVQACPAKNADRLKADWTAYFSPKFDLIHDFEFPGCGTSPQGRFYIWAAKGAWRPPR